ncbi:MAG: glycosyltransferase family 2 protein [Acholeplasmataceae bacterium]
MKYITFAVPSYNSEAYLHNAIDSLLVIGEDAEIIIVNDGSTDKTLQIALLYQKKYPKIVKVIDKENGGHGSGVNAGLKEATGLYYKVVDSDDWLDKENIFHMLDVIKKHHKANTLPDLYLYDFIYEHVEDNTTFVRTYQENFPHGKIFGWNEALKKFKYSKTILMHAMIFKTSVLKESKVSLPHHTFYVDNIFAYTPLFYTNTIYYEPKVLYHYYIGRADQSIQLKNIVSRYQQQIKVMNIVLNVFSYEEIKSKPKYLRHYLKHFLSAIMIITQMFTTGEYSKERKKDLKKLWKDLKISDRKLYNFLRFRSYNTPFNYIPFRLKGKIMLKGYKILANKVKLG